MAAEIRDYKYVTCRAWKHDFQLVRNPLARERHNFGALRGWIAVTWRCSDCGTLRWDICRPSSGEKDHSQYRRPRDYRLGQPYQKADFRKEWFRREAIKQKRRHLKAV